MNNWTEISAEHLANNFAALQAAAGAAKSLLAVVKANAYGHGAEACAVILARAGACWLGVTGVEEGGRVRQALQQAGRTADVLVMSGFLPQDVSLFALHQLVPVVWTGDHVASLAAGMRIHVEVDTGMGRQGVLPGQNFEALLKQIAGRGLELDGLFTHFCSSEEVDSPLTRLQQRRFEEAVAQVRDAGLTPRWLHAGNSSSVDNPVQPTAWLPELAASVQARAMVRPGLALYGYCLALEGDAAPQVSAALQPVLTWKARVLAVRDLGVGESVGYNATFTATHPMRVALLPVGYADGLRRELSSTTSAPGGWVMLDGRRAAILGRVSMNLTVVDVTEIPGVGAGDEAILLGLGITANDHAALADTIAYEILCNIHPCG